MDTDVSGLRTWVEIDTQKLKHNYDLFRSRIAKNVRLMGVAKSNAYGHDMTQYAHQLQALEVDAIGVDSIVEAKTLREAGITVPLLVLGYTLPERYGDAAATDTAITISSVDAARNIAKYEGSHIKVHIKIDTGMHRQGIDPSEVSEVLDVLLGNQAIVIEGAYTHFAAAKNPSIRDITDGQVAIFKEVKKHIEGRVPSCIFHAAATGGTLIYPEAHFDLVRVGIGLYGLWPSGPTRAAFESSVPLEPILTWKTRISEIKTVRKGEGVGYDLTERPIADTRVAVCPVGYWHGYVRAYSSTGVAFVNDHKVRVMGRVSMDMISLDLTGAGEVSVGDEVVLLNKSVDADYLAGISETSNYEVVTRINPLIKRIYV